YCDRSIPRGGRSLDHTPALKLPPYSADTTRQSMVPGEQNKEQRGERSNQRVKRVALPSGKTIEVVYFDQTPVPEALQRQELHVCPDCDASLVYPVHWTEVDRASWEVTLRCPNCEWIHTGIFDQETVERF